MFEQVLQHFLSALGAGDSLIAAMGPGLTILLSWVFGGAVAQLLKFPLSRAITDPWFSYIVRVLAVMATLVFVHLLSDTVPLWLEIGAAMAQPLAYHGSLAVIRRYWPWLEASRSVGSVNPPAAAFTAAAQRVADKSGENSGA